jgi:serine phosphatase RsbU (regulator of sigma subunit)
VVVEASQRRTRPAHAERGAAAAVVAFAETGPRLAGSASLREALAVLVQTAARAVPADVVVARTRDQTGPWLVTRAVAAPSASLVAELEGCRLPVDSLPHDELDELETVPDDVRRAAERSGATAVLQIPVRLGGAPVGSLELMRSGGPFTPAERPVARLAAGQLALAARALEPPSDGRSCEQERTVELLGDALAAAADGEPAPHVARLAALATGARAALLSLTDGAGGPVVAASHGLLDGKATSAALRDAASRALADRGAAQLETAPDVAGAGTVLATLRLGEPPLGVLQLLFATEAAPNKEDVARLATLAVRAAQTLRSGEHARTLRVELERTRALLAVLGQAIEQLSLSHTLETATERVAELLSVERVAVYLREGDGVHAAAARGVGRPHAALGQRLLELALGPYRARGVLIVPDARTERRLSAVADAVTQARIEMVLAVPLRVNDEVIGLLAAYPERGRPVLPGETDLLAALAAQLAVAVQNARLHEQAKRLGQELEQALVAERQTARELRALSEISGSFVETLSLERTLEAIARALVQTFDLDAAAIRMLDRRRELLVTRAVHVAAGAVGDALRALLSRPQPLSGAALDLLRSGRPLMLEAAAARRFGAAHELLAPFLAKGSTAAVLPLASGGEMLATLTLLSLDPERPITGETAASARSVASHAALAIDNARLYQQQKDFADTMQRSLLPQREPELEGFELGHVYESSGRMDVGGDVYDYLFVDDRRLAVVLGDVVGHGTRATADMAMAKFAFRSLAREHAEPGDFLAAANEVFLGEVEVGKFVTMTYLLFDLESGVVACASAGHPPPRLVPAEGSVVPLGATGLALGVDSAQTYPEFRETIQPGSSVVLHTDGVVEARRDGELYGTERLDALLAERRDAAAGELAVAVLEDCRAFGRGELVDDCAVVVVRRCPS